MRMHRKSHTPRAAAVALGLTLATATVLAGCAGDPGGGDETGGSEAPPTSVPIGAGAAEYQAALADMEPITLAFQVGTNPGDPQGVPYELMMEHVEEYSGGKITFEVHYASSLVPNPVELPAALVDGRLDISLFWPQYAPAEYPASDLLLSSTVGRDPQLVTGWFSEQGSFQETALGTPEVLAEWEDAGLVPLLVFGADAPPLLQCREPLTSLADFANKQIRSPSVVHSRQLEALGAIPVSMAFPEVYEALQRGILDCSLATFHPVTFAPRVEVAPYAVSPSEASFISSPTSIAGGARVAELPAVARQLLVESAQIYASETPGRQLSALATEVWELVEENGGAFVSFGADAEARLAEVNREIAADVEASTVLDGADLLQRADAARGEWVPLVNELGYEDLGPKATFNEWFEGPDALSGQRWYQAALERIVPLYPID